MGQEGGQVMAQVVVGTPAVAGSLAAACTLAVVAGRVVAVRGCL